MTIRPTMFKRSYLSSGRHLNFNPPCRTPSHPKISLLPTMTSLLILSTRKHSTTSTHHLSTMIPRHSWTASTPRRPTRTSDQTTASLLSSLKMTSRPQSRQGSACDTESQTSHHQRQTSHHQPTPSSDQLPQQCLATPQAGPSTPTTPQTENSCANASP